LEVLFGITEQKVINEYYFFYYLFLTILFLISAYGIRQIYNHFIKNSIQFPTITGIFTLIYLAICALLFVYNYTYEEMLGFPQDVMQVNTFLFTVFFVITGIFIAVLMYVLKRDARLQAQNVQYESLQNYTAQVEELYQNIRGFKHDYVNILTTMHFYIESEDWEALKTYYETEILPTSNSFQDSTQVLGQLSNLQIPELKSLLYNKFVKALELGINVQLEIRKPVENISAKNVDIARVMGIYLDNAIEALNEPELEAGQRNLTVAVIREEDAVSFIVQNSCKEFRLNLHKLGSLSYSTKGKHRGMGLHLAAQTLHHYKNIEKDTTYENHVFTQTLKIFDE
ncbi:MAG: GHKL domain-containing protein, partial [Lachnospiraceae bacterium]|nr:GHKL domain-containing protein [Lachnospiraceae bacterium]